jgi:hypothetical protein
MPLSVFEHSIRARYVEKTMGDAIASTGVICKTFLSSAFR